jgi:tetratricopeptide (TPR) repeat protein
MFRLNPTYLLIILGVLMLQSVGAQEKQEGFRKITDSILDNRLNSLQIFDGAMKPYNRDSVLLEYFIEESKAENQWEGLSYGLNQMGEMHMDAARYESAIRYHEEALDAALEAGNIEFRIYSLNMLGATYFRIDSIKKALDYYEAARLLGESVNTSNERTLDEISRAFSGIGKIYHSMGQYVLGIRQFQKSLELYEKSGNRVGLATAYGNIGECLEATGDLDESLAHYQRSLGISKSVGAEKIEIISTTGIAHVLAHMDQGEEGVKLIEPVLQKARAIGDEELLSLVHIQTGWVLIHLEQYDRAMEHLMQGLALAKKQQLTPYLYDSHLFIHTILEAQGDYENALIHFKQAQTERNKIANKTNRRYIFDALSKTEEAKWNNVVEGLSKENEIAYLQLRKNRNTLLIGALLLILFSLILYIIYRQYAQNNERKIMALEQSRLRSQMNPHFLFNSLNSIKHYIINNEQKNAVHYLNKFSKLIRKILESSTTKEITLEEELETVTLYMNIENIRFNDDIDFKVEIAPEINPATVKIPSLILQPFLENALWHGLSTKEGEKKIRLVIRQDSPGIISIAIRDNGIGRDASKVLKEQKVLKRKSVGISNTRQRLASFYKVYRNSFKILIEDLYKEDGSAEGTNVLIQIPVI